MAKTHLSEFSIGAWQERRFVKAEKIRHWQNGVLELGGAQTSELMQLCKPFAIFGLTIKAKSKNIFGQLDGNGYVKSLYWRTFVN